MPNSDYNTIKPVESLQNITGLAGVKDREERKRRGELNSKKEQEPEQELNEPVDEENPSNELAEDESDRHSIDYRA